MSFTLLNLFSALALGVLIATMASVKNVHLKAAIYTLPVTITVALIATNGVIDSGSIIGLALVCVFIWLTETLHKRLRIPILISDIMAAVLYVTAGYFIVNTINPSFHLATAVYLAFWVPLVWWAQKHPLTVKPHKPSAIPPALKGVATSGVGLVLFSVKDALAGVVVTFPFSGVFAVLETKDHLQVLLRTLIRNSVAIIALLVAMYPLQGKIHLAVEILIGWAAYLLVLKLVRRLNI